MYEQMFVLYMLSVLFKHTAKLSVLYKQYLLYFTCASVTYKTHNSMYTLELFPFRVTKF